MKRISVPNDHSCLFSSLTTLLSPFESTQSLREIVSSHIAAHPDDYPDFLLGRPNAEYCAWILNPTTWGGELELSILSQHFKCNVSIVNMWTASIINFEFPVCDDKRIFLLYTGSHYDPLVKFSGECIFAANDSSVTEMALACAAAELIEAQSKLNQRKVKKIQCGGCDSLLDSPDDFQSHCMETEHGDDFAYDCSEVEIVEEISSGIPEGRLDLNDPNIFSFYNTHGHIFSLQADLPVTVFEASFPTAWHALMSRKYEHLAARIIACTTVSEVNHLIAEHGEPSTPSWDEFKEQFVNDIVLAKALQNESVIKLLKSTGEKNIVAIDSDRWLGVSGASGVPTGANSLGKALCLARTTLT